MLYHFTITIYNSAGEEVKTIAAGSPAANDPQGDFSLDKSAFASKNGQVLLITAGGQVLTWAGDDNGGQFIQNGVYYVKLESTDQFGHVATVTHEVSVLSAAHFYSVKIFSSSGEEVNSLVVSAYGANAPSHFSEDKKSIAVGSGTGSAGTVTFDLGNGSTVTWDGTNSHGEHVMSGSYMAQLTETHDGAPKSVSSLPVTVLNVAEGLLGGAVVAPNPLNLLGMGGHPRAGAGVAIVQLKTPASVQVIGRLYNLAGELILTATNDMAPGQLTFDLAGRQVSSGTYIIALTAKAPWGTVERRTLKLVMMR